MSIKMATTEHSSELILFWKDWKISNRTYPYLFEEVLKKKINKVPRKTGEKKDKLIKPVKRLTYLT